MSNRWLALVPGLAALACAIIVLYLAIQIDQTRKQLQNDGVLEFNFVQQVDHNLDTLAQALMSYLVTNESDKNSLKAAYIKQYDIVYSSIKSVNDRWLGNLAELQATDAFFDAANNFLDRYELSMSIDVELESSQLIQINQEALELSKQVYEIGLQMFERKSTARNQISQRMDELYFSQRMFGLFFALTLLLTIALLVAMYRRAAILQSAAVTTGVQLSTALDELTTGNNERRAQNRFMAAASHDLRQPLHALGLYLSSLERYIPSAEGKNILANTHRSTEALKQLLNSMLDLSKLDAGVVDIDPVNLDLDALFNHLLQSFLPEAKQRQLAFDVQFSGLAVNSDRLLLERILGNLVANALSYTEVGQVSLRATALESQVCISISDTGSGIPVHEQEAIFDEFYQLQNPERDRNKGLGLGLSIVKRLTRLLKLDLKIKSEEGKGTTFQLMLPRASETETRLQETGVSAISAPDDLTGLSILIIDDEQEVREGMRTWLVQKECEVLLADSIDQALELIVAISWIPDLIIADYRLRNNETGDSAIVKVREEVNVDIPAMIITGDTSPARLREATASGFHLLHKPVVVEDLLSIISELVREFRLASSNVEVSGKSNQVKYS